MFPCFFDKFGSRLVMEYDTEDIQRRIGSTSAIAPLEGSSTERVHC